jgi:hypothetical protein
MTPFGAPAFGLLGLAFHPERERSDPRRATGEPRQVKHVLEP